jgi:hypothetical protein
MTIELLTRGHRESAPLCPFCDGAQTSIWSTDGINPDRCDSCGGTGFEEEA